MPPTTTTPEALRAYLFHGLDLSWKGPGSQATGDCPLCGKPGKFYVSKDTGQYDCKVCGAAGNSTTFLRQLHAISLDHTIEAAYDELAEERGLLYGASLASWGVVQSYLTGEWLVPGYSAYGAGGTDGQEPKLVQLYRYAMQPGDKESRMVLWATPGLSHGLLGANTWNDKATEVRVCEGPWDGIALWEVMGLCRASKEAGLAGAAAGLVETANPESSLLKDCNVVATPSCGVFREEWVRSMVGKRVCLLYDNDHPRTNPETKVVTRAGLDGMKRACLKMAAADQQPKEVLYLKWGDEGGGVDTNLPDGHDVRDWLTVGVDEVGNPATTGLEGRLGALAVLQDMLVPIPKEWIEGAKARGQVIMEPLACASWKELLLAWRRALKWNEGLELALAAILATVCSTGQEGDQLWLKVISPPSTGKTTLCEGITVSRRYVFAKSNITGIHSGYKEDKEGTKDFGLVGRMSGKTFVIKDGDTFLNASNRGQTMAHLRDLYDRVTRTHYRHGKEDDQEGVSTTVIIAGTGSLRCLDDTELGDRFINVTIMDDIDPVFEREVSLRNIYHIRSRLGCMVNGDPESFDTPEKVRAKRLTGGYVNYLRENASKLLHRVLLSDDVAEELSDLATFVAYFRCRPSKRQDENVERELNTRLSGQFTVLAACLAVVMQKTSVDEDVMERVRKMARDTAQGNTLRLAGYLYSSAREGLSTDQIKTLTGEAEEKLPRLLKFLLKVKVVEMHRKRLNALQKSKPRWRLTEDIHRLFQRVMGPTLEPILEGE